MTMRSWAQAQLDQLRNDPEFELEALLLEINETWVQRLNELGWSRSEFAARLGVSRAFITKLLNGNTNITLLTALKVCNVLGLKLEVSMLSRHTQDAKSSDQNPETSELALYNRSRHQ